MDEEDYEGPSIGDIEALAQEFAETTQDTPRRRNVILPRTLEEALAAALNQHLDPWTSANGRWIGFDCPICKTLGRKAAATIEQNPAGFLQINCAGCNDDVEPGILAALGTIHPNNGIPLHTPNGAGPVPTSVRHLVTLLDLDELLAHPPPDPDFAWGNTTGGYIEIGTCAVLHGDGGLGKSLIGQGLCRRYTLGREWLGQTTSGGTALYLDGENSEAEIARRLYSFQFRPSDTNLHYGRVHMPIFRDPAAGEALIAELIAETNATLIVLDSQRALWGGDEKEQMEIRPLYDMLARAAEKHQVAILLIHHDNKGGVYSGSTDINAAVSSRIHLERKNPKDREDRRRVLWHEKSRSGPEQPPVTFTVDKNHESVLEFTIHSQDTPQTPGIPRTDMRQRVLDLLSDRVPRTRPEVARELGLEASNGTLRRVWDDLHKEQALTSSDNLHWTPAEGVAT